MAVGCDKMIIMTEVKEVVAAVAIIAWRLRWGDRGRRPFMRETR